METEAGCCLNLITLLELSSERKTNDGLLYRMPKDEPRGGKTVHQMLGG
jgi:hypothetical protein